jgi:hypothetical protein
MILEAIDIQLETNKQESLIVGNSLSIEHIYPQTPLEGAWQPLSDPELLHTFGNLTLLTTALNSSVSNGAYEQKRSEIAKQSKLRLNSQFQDVWNLRTWHDNEIRKRGEALFAVALLIWR